MEKSRVVQAVYSLLAEYIKRLARYLLCIGTLFLRVLKSSLEILDEFSLLLELL